ncbi:hypothetical protein E0H70_28125 [Rhizobium leguminosarum bv. viciae]|nr:hypothetical protein E0H70_28125 [Rhizobium leguminosarum bv. viciae]
MLGRAQGPAPPRWGNDALTEYFEQARRNQFACLVGREAEVADLIAIDGMLLRLLEGAKDPRPFVPMTFLMRSHSAYRAACGSVMSGQLYEAQALLRLCLEHASYGHYIGGDNAMWERWMRRNDSEANRAGVRKEFTANKVRQRLRDADQTVAKAYETLYEQLIDFGAHPNEKGFSMSSNIRRENGDVHIEAVYLHADGLPLRVALRTTAQVGICVLRVGQLIYADRVESLGIDVDLKAIMQRF